MLGALAASPLRAADPPIPLSTANPSDAKTPDAKTHDEIIVTAPSASDTARLRDTPGNAQVLRGDPLTQQNHGNLADLLNANLGAVSLSNGSGSPYQSDVSYRGFQATSLLGAPTGLSIYVDGVRMNEPFGGIVNWDLIPMNVIASVSVLPGSNPLFGLNTLGGALVVATKNGAEDGGLAVTAQAGSWRHRLAQAEAGGTLADKALDWFVAGTYDHQDGYRLFTHTTVKQLYGKLRWHGGGAAAELGVSWADTRLNGTQSLPLAMLATSWQAYTAPDDVANRQIIVNLRAKARVSSAITISGNGYYRRAHANAVNSNASLDDACLSQGGSEQACADAAPGGTARDLDVVNPYLPGSAAAAHFSPYTGSLSIHDDTGAIDSSLTFSTTHQDIWGGNGLIDIDAALIGLDHDINLGASFEAASITYAQNTDLAVLVNYQTVPMPWNLLYGSPGGFTGDPLINAVAISSHTTSGNIFARDLIKLTPRLSLTASLSATVTHVGLSGASSTYLAANGAYRWVGEDGATYYNPGYLGALSWQTTDTAPSSLVAAEVPAGGVAGPEVEPLNGQHGYHRWNPAVGFTWNPARALGVFANVSTAMRAPTAIELACADPSRPCALPTGFNGDPGLKAVVAHTLEVGARGRMRLGAGAARVDWNVAWYRTLIDNDIAFIYNNAGLGYFTNVGGTERKGFELGLAADIKAVHLAASYGAVAATFRARFLDANGDMVTPGDHLPGIPGRSFKLRATWAPAAFTTLGASLITTASQFAHGDEANRNPMVPGYALVNLDARIALRPRLMVLASVTNLFDRRYASFGVLGGDIYTGQNTQFRTPAPGRAFMLGLRYGFGGAGEGHSAADGD